MNQSKLELIACAGREAREKACERIMIGFGLTSDWMKNWRQSCIVERQNQSLSNAQMKLR